MYIHRYTRMCGISVYARVHACVRIYMCVGMCVCVNDSCTRPRPFVECTLTMAEWSVQLHNKAWCVVL